MDGHSRAIAPAPPHAPGAFGAREPVDRVDPLDPVEPASGAGGGPSAQGAVHDVAVEVLRHGPLPRSQLARRLGLSAGSLTRLSKPLIASGLLVEAPPAADPETRRPTRPLDIPAGRHRFIGVDVAGDAVWGVLTDLRSRVLAREDVPLLDRSPGTVTEAVARLVTALAVSAGGMAAIDEIGVSLDGYVDGAGVVRTAPVLGWPTPVAFTAALESRLGRRVVVGNGMHAFTQTEHWFGEGRSTTSFAVLAVGAGIGYGLVMHDALVETPDTARHLLGHHPLDSSGPRCPSGHRGCATSLLTLPALEAAGTLALGRATRATQLLALASAGDAVARMVVDDAARHLGTMLAAVANFTMVERILLTGDAVGVATIGRASLDEGIRAARAPDASPLDLVVRADEPWCWGRGAAGMAIQAYVSGPEWLALESAQAV
ncbi:Sugar kinase of the NBD/HSP70 family, may contain an N-terminal HTH domain [Quadrisphaera granulorum]|uniref:Putative NBD/HSP70 family sugar kinase n=1 Tax=Quadrisphaera granulorum TaxID=317664 RepID=A0A316AA75_9ACTN|nr:ROK family transcriptional regulator [Quadrisphaera granulorum]PWJ54675.1 putative NBD/HSP70 family sugar kinase [Quadrisphaera granulorum]SZE96037.1 Sugar kinase of the NBD/HSP70 family, may contain an N-terminal HTH domain [Quadrisphaera granulorum]